MKNKENTMIDKENATLVIITVIITVIIGLILVGLVYRAGTGEYDRKFHCGDKVRLIIDGREGLVVDDRGFNTTQYRIQIRLDKPIEVDRWDYTGIKYYDYEDVGEYEIEKINEFSKKGGE